MHHAVVESWAQRENWLHARDARVKEILLLAFLIAIATTSRMSLRAAACYALCVVAGIMAGRLPAGSVLLRAGVVLPFSAVFALFAILAGDSQRAVSLILKSYLSAAAVLVIVATTPLPSLLRAMESFGLPRFFVLVVQFLYRYLFVISEQAQHMRAAAASRGGGRFTLRSGSSALATLFARTYTRAEGIHHAMLARGYSGCTLTLAPPRASLIDGLLLAASLFAIVALRLWNR